MIMREHWPERIWLVRHGESAGNVALAAANAAGLPWVDVAQRDADVPLSQRGEQQAGALGRWFAESPDRAPDVVLTSPYLRARQTAERVAGPALALTVDERLREREFGILDRLTRAGIVQLQPQQAELRTLLGKFYHRPPGGESWCDIILRLRSALDTISLHHAGQRVLIVCHQVVVLCFRYLLEKLDEEKLLAIDALGDVANCSITEYGFSPDAGGNGEMRLERYNFVVPLQQEGAPVTTAPDANVAAR